MYVFAPCAPRRTVACVAFCVARWHDDGDAPLSALYCVARGESWVGCTVGCHWGKGAARRAKGREATLEVVQEVGGSGEEGGVQPEEVKEGR